MIISSAKNVTKLTPKQQAFVDEYFICRNGAEAARRAQYKARSARQMAAENLTKPVIIDAIAAKEAGMTAELELDRNTIVGGLFMGIAQARVNGEAGNVIKGWVEVSKLLGLDKPVTTKSNALSPANQALEARLAQMTDAELYALMEGRSAI